MSRFSKKAVGHPLGALHTKLKNQFTGDLVEITHNTSLAGQVASLESLNDTQLESVQSSYDAVCEGIVTSMEELRASQMGATGDLADLSHGLEDFQLEAGGIVGAASGNLGAFATSTRAGRTISNEAATTVKPSVVGAAGHLDYVGTLNAALESFDEQELDKYKEFTVAFNVLASRQDAFGEALFPTQVCSPDQGGLEGQINRAVVFRPVTRSTAGTAADFKERNLIDGYVDDSVLASTATKIVPMVQAGAEDNFVADADIQHTTMDVDGQAVTTGYLATGVEFDLIGLSQTDAVIRNGVTDHTDSLDRAPAIDKVALKLSVDQGGSPEDVFLSFDVRHFGRSEFVPAREGEETELSLNFPVRGLMINEDTKQIDSSPLPADFKALVAASGGLSLRFNTSLSGNADIRTASVVVNTAGVTVAGAQDADGNELALTDTAVAAAIAGIEDMSVIGFKVDAYRSNLNLRSEGHLLDSRAYTELYPAMLGAPLTVQKAISSDAARNGAMLETLINAARIRTSNNAVITLQNFAATMKSIVGPSHTAPGANASGLGLGRFMVTPYYQEVDLDVQAAMNSTRAHERARDVQGVIVNQIRSLVYQMYRDCGYSSALDSYTGGSGLLPRVVIATDEQLSRHVQIDGDLRVAGPNMDYVIVDTGNTRVRNRIYLTFVRQGSNGVDPLSFGFHVWQPELVTRANVSRGGAHPNETIVQPRSTHYVSCPVLSVINVEGIKEALEEKTVSP